MKNYSDRLTEDATLSIKNFISDLPDFDATNLKLICDGFISEAFDPFLNVFSPISHRLFGQHLKKVFFSPANVLLSLFSGVSLFLFFLAIVFDNFFSKKTIGLFSIYHLFVIGIIFLFIFLAFRYSKYIKQFIENRKIDIQMQLRISTALYKIISSEIDSINKDTKDLFKIVSTESFSKDKTNIVDTLPAFIKAHLRSNDYNNAEQLLLSFPSGHLKPHASKMLADPDFHDFLNHSNRAKTYLQDLLQQ